MNGKGYDRALDTAVDEVNVSIAATDGFGLKNQGLDRAGQIPVNAWVRFNPIRPFEAINRP